MGQPMSHGLWQNVAIMPRKTPYYCPKISRFLVSVLYHEARSRQMPMTALTEYLLREVLEGGPSWRTAEAASLVREDGPCYTAEKKGAVQSAVISSAGIGSSNAGNGSRRVSPERAVYRASPTPSNPARASKGATLQRLPGNQNSPTLKEFHRACGESASNKL